MHHARAGELHDRDEFVPHTGGHALGARQSEVIIIIRQFMIRQDAHLGQDQRSHLAGLFDCRRRFGVPVFKHLALTCGVFHALHAQQGFLLCAG